MLKNKFKYKIITLLFILTVSLSGVLLVYAQSATTSSNVADIINEIVNSNPEDNNLTFNARGIYNCEGAQYARVGLPGPSGPFVPVFAQATHSQTQLLTYKECVLDKIAAHNANAILAGLVSTYIKLVNDNNLIITDWTEYLKKEAEIPAVKEFLQNCKEIYKDNPEVCSYVASEKLEKISDDYSNMKCPVASEIVKKFLDGENVGFENMVIILSNNACTPAGQYLAAQNTLNNLIQEKLDKARQEGQSGIKPAKQKKTIKEIDLEKSKPGALVFKDVEKNIVVTPGAIVAEQLNIALGSGIRKVESVDEIDEMVQSFLANLSNRALDAVNYGVYGMTRSINDAPSYTARLLEQEQKVAAQFRAYAGGLSLANMIENETAYIGYKQDMVKHILNAIHDLRNYENICFDSKILEGAKDALSEQVKTAACSNYNPSSGSGSNNQNNSCPYTASVNTEILPNFIDIKEYREGNTIEHGKLVFSGKAPNGQGTLNITSLDKKATSKSETVSLSSDWSATLNHDELPEGDLKVELHYPNGELYSTEFYKETIAGIPVLVLPNERYRIKIEAESQSQSATVTLEKNRSNSSVYTGQNGALTNLLKTTLEEIDATNKVIEALYKIAADAQNNPELANWKVDQLVADQLIHTASAVKDAEAAASSVAGRMSELVQGVVQDEWEADGAGWCNKDKWEAFKIN